MMNPRLSSRSYTDWLPLYRTQGPAWCRYTVMQEHERYSYAALAAMVQVAFFEGETKC